MLYKRPHRKKSKHRQHHRHQRAGCGYYLLIATAAAAAVALIREILLRNLDDLDDDVCASGSHPPVLPACFVHVFLPVIFEYVPDFHSNIFGPHI